jgi:hypothetical protein
MSPPPAQPSPAAGNRIEIWKLGISALGVIVTVGSLVYGVAAYFDQRDAQIAQRGLEIEAMQRDSKRKFLDKQFDLYVEAVATVARLTTSPAYAKRAEDLARFWQLYWGELGIVEDPQVEGAMVALGRIIPDLDAQPALARSASLNLSRCVKNSIAASWGVELGGKPCRSYQELVDAGSGEVQ